MDLRIRGVVAKRHGGRVGRNEVRQAKRDNGYPNHHSHKTY